MIRDAAERVPAIEAAADDVLQRLAAVAPDRVHLQIAAVVVDARSAERRVSERGEDLRAAEKVTAEVAPPLDIGALRAFGYRTLDRRRRSGLQHFQNHA